MSRAYRPGRVDSVSLKMVPYALALIFDNQRLELGFRHISVCSALNLWGTLM